METPLGRTAFLRKVGGKYLINCKTEHQWWEIYLLEVSGQGSVILRQLQEKDMANIPYIAELYEVTSDYYLEAAWTEAEAIEIIHKGGFSDTLLDLRPEMKLSQGQ
jgi:hypothetical protein